MIRVLFFASLREALGTAEIAVPWQAGLELPAGLIAAIARQQGEAAAAILADEQVICAHNQRVCKHPTALNAGDEVAFYPPVTGG
ncbi:MAG TPA: MoaD/ThiS family protein [Spongiibacteraceae bacterium]|jgi:molybdopterin synthase sulfur carrier subunit|nr:MoaD/ThiS family protein [Spongiibacteraceae bacterium]HUH37943.1 MoaD/ThiS family protein [Spongiibacteraceae bacterium]